MAQSSPPSLSSLYVRRLDDDGDGRSELLRDHAPYLVARPGLVALLERRPLGLAIDPHWTFDPTRVDSADFLALIARLDCLAFGAAGLSMPRWALYDCAELPGAIVGLAQPATSLSRRLREVMNIADDYRGPVPVSMQITVPTMDGITGHAGTALAHTLASLNDAVPGVTRPGITSLTLELAAALWPTQVFMTTAQWASPKLSSYARFAPLRLLAAHLPSHSEPRTAVFAFETRDDEGASLVPSRRAATRLEVDAFAGPVESPLDPWQSGATEALQERIEAGERWAIIGPPRQVAASMRVPIGSLGDREPIHRVAPAAGWAGTHGVAARKSTVANVAAPIGTVPRATGPRLTLDNPALLENLEPFIVATAATMSHLDRLPMGIPVADDACFDPLRVGSHAFLELLCRLDSLTFGPEGMPMPRWIFFDGADLSGAVIGFGCRRARLDEEACTLMEVPAGYTGVVPLSMYIAIPSFEPDTWVGHNLASLSQQLAPLGLGGLGRLTKATALAAMGATHQIGVTQWASPALFVHVRAGPLELMTAHTAAHSNPASLTYRLDVTPRGLRALAGVSGAKPTFAAASAWIDADDEDGQAALQERLEAGERYAIVGRPERNATGQRVPIRQMVAEG